MNRLTNFENLESHAWFCKIYKKLTTDEVALAHNFINECNGLDKNEYATKAVRLFLGKAKPKHWKEIEELLIASI